MGGGYDKHPLEWKFQGDACHTPHPSPGFLTQSKVLLHRGVFRKIIVYAIKQRKKLFIHVNPRTYMQIHTPIVIQEGWMDPPRVFDMLQYFETILPAEESL